MLHVLLVITVFYYFLLFAFDNGLTLTVCLYGEFCEMARSSLSLITPINIIFCNFQTIEERRSFPVAFQTSPNGIFYNYVSCREYSYLLLFALLSEGNIFIIMMRTDELLGNPEKEERRTINSHLIGIRFGS